MSIENFQEANKAILEVYVSGIPNWTEFQVAKFKDIISGVVAPEQVSHFTEFAYAQRDSLSAPARMTAADVATFAGKNSFFGLGVDSRGFRIAAVLRGETVDPLPVPSDAWIEPEPVESAPEIVPPPVPEIAE